MEKALRLREKLRVKLLCVAAAGSGQRGGAWITELGLAVRRILARVASRPLISFSLFEHTTPL
jgi:hypothetical protein